MNRIHVGFLFLSSLLLLAGRPADPLLAQGVASAGVRGTVADSAGAPVAGASVEVRHEGTGATAGTVTGRDGVYLLVGLAPGGPYTLSASAFGFAPSTVEGLFLQGGQNLRLDLRLRPRAVELPGVAVEVERDAIISAARTGAATLFGERAVHTVPILSRNVVELSALSPLVTLDSREISIAGQNHLYNSLRVDGALSQDVFGLSPSGVPGGEAFGKPLPLDAVQQYQVLVAPFDVRQSGFTGGILNAVTRSGTNEWRGAAAGHYRDAWSGGSADDPFAASTTTGDFATRLFSASAGGPLRHDRTHLFVAGELERRSRPVPGFSLGSADPVRMALAPEALAELQRILGEDYGVEPGRAARFGLENPLANLFARLDHRIGERHRLTARYIGIGAENDAAPNRAPTGPYELESNTHRFTSRTHAGSVQVVSSLGGGVTGEFLLNAQRTRDRTHPASAFPQLDVHVVSEFEGSRFRRRVRAGAAATAQLHELDQDVLQLSAALTRGFGRHAITAGLDLERHQVRHLFVPNALGAWRFQSLADLAAGQAVAFERTILDPEHEPAVRFSFLQPAAFVQDEWSPHPRLSLTFGLRAESPRLPERAEHNPELADALEAYTNELPRPGLLLSPRFGFNWHRGDAFRTQLRGGAGVFSGRPPLTWIADAYRSTGLGRHILVCRGESVPSFDPAGTPPADCPPQEREIVRQAVFFDRDVRFPRDARGSVAIDQELPGGFVLTLEGVYTRALRQVDLVDLNIAEEASDPGDRGAFAPGFGDRPYYGDPTLPIAYRTRRLVEGYGPIIQVVNGERNSAFGASVELQRRFAERLDVRAAYSYSGSYDTRSLSFPDGPMNFGMTALRGDPNAAELTWSDYHRPHKVVGSAWARVAERGGGTEISLLYLGQSGRPYSYVYDGDANGDGYPGPGQLADAHNDLVHVPQAAGEIPGSFLTQSLWFRMTRLDPCFRGWSGHVMGRNACFAPWSHRLDVRVVQGLEVGRGNVRIVADVLNVLNLLDRRWGLVQDVQPRVPVLELLPRPEGVTPGSAGEQPVTYTGPLARDPDTGAIGPALPFTPSMPDSHWRAQLGIRIEF